MTLTPLGLLLARESYRNLGHGLAKDHLITRHGVGARRTAALLRHGVIGWTITSSPFQRRAGLITLHATIAANKGAYPIYDIGTEEALTFAAEAVPALLTPFLESEDLNPPTNTDPDPSLPHEADAEGALDA